MTTRGGLTPGLQRRADEAAAKANALGHRIGRFQIEMAWHAAVATCLACERIVAVDITEAPYVFGRALEKKCERRRIGDDAPPRKCK